MDDGQVLIYSFDIPKLTNPSRVPPS